MCLTYQVFFVWAQYSSHAFHVFLKTTTLLLCSCLLPSLGVCSPLQNTVILINNKSIMIYSMSWWQWVSLWMQTWGGGNWLGPWGRMRLYAAVLGCFLWGACAMRGWLLAPRFGECSSLQGVLCCSRSFFVHWLKPLLCAGRAQPSAGGSGEQSEVESCTWGWKFARRQLSDNLSFAANIFR